MSSKNLRLFSTVPGAGMARTEASFSTSPANRPKPEPLKCSPTSLISSGFLRSGLSVPYLSSASLYGIRGNSPAGVTVRPLANSSNTPDNTGSMAANTSSWVTKLEITVFEPDLFGIILLAEHRHRQLARRGLDGDGARADFDLPGRKVSVHRFRRASNYLAFDRDDRLNAKPVERLERRRTGV